jgi:predicted O-linked N-acetylglucosamine transferase (SPINDLY family)
LSLPEALRLHRAGRRRDALPLYARALAQNPGDPQLLYAYGLCLLETGDLAAGRRVMTALVGLRPGDAAARYALGKVLALAGEAGAAEAELRQAALLAPGMGEAWLELGNLLARARPDAAEAALREGLTHRPRDAALWCNLGNVLAERGRRPDAEAAWRKALDIDPGLVQAELALALARRAQGDAAGAAAMLEQAAKRRPDVAELHHNLGVTYFHARRLDLAVAALERAASGPKPPRKAAVHLAQAAQAACDWERFERLQPTLRAEVDAALAGKPCEISPFFSLSLRLTEAERAAVARAKAREIELRVAPDRAAAALERRWPARDAPGPLRIGYLCSDFRDHPTSHLTAGLFSLHDRAKVRVAAYSYGPDDGSAYRRRVERSVDAFADLAAVNHVEAAERIAADGVQVLIDLNGWITHSRPEIAAMRPAPVQATYLAFPGTTGADFFGYALADAVVTPPASQAHYAEKLVLLPDSYQVNDRDQAAGPPAARAAEGLPDGAFVYCCFCANFKIERPLFEAWMRLLRTVPDSVLWLFAESAEAERNLKAAAARAGIAGGRLAFATRKPKSEHLARLALADLFLDTLTYGAHTTASDALRAGVPVLTCRGDSFASRVGASLLAAAGLPELVAGSPEEYEALALKLAADRGRLAALKAKLAQNRAACALFDTARTCRNLERAYAAMWSRYSQRLPPDVIDLTGPQRPGRGAT